MTAEVRHAPAADRFEVWTDGQRAGHVEYLRRDGRWILTHAEIDPAHEGEGLGSVLVRKTLDHVRADDALVVPLCPFVHGWIERHDDYADLVDVELYQALR